MLRLTNVSKTFPGTLALDRVSLEIAPGEIRGLAGQNGSGKSTLIKVLSGYVQPDSGSEVEVNGEAANLPLNASEANRLGLCFLHQDLGLVETVSVLENLSVGSFHTGRLGRIRWNEERDRARAELERVGLDVDPQTPVRDLAPAERALVALARALRAAAGRTTKHLLLLDEPTAYLSRVEVLRLLEVMRDLAGAGNAVLFVSHRLPEITDSCDTVSFLRDGRLVATENVTPELTHSRMMEYMFGQVGLKSRSAMGRSRPNSDEVLLRATGLTGTRLKDFDIEVRSGEIVGITGLAGMGQDELPGLVFGSTRRVGGSVEVAGHPVTDIAAALRAGLAFVPADRLGQGIVPEASATENVMMRSLRPHFRHGWLSLRKVRAAAKDLMVRFDVQPPIPGRRMSAFSGGNQQKALLARWLNVQPRLLLLHEPTSGVDVLSKQRILEIVAETAAAGCGVMICSAEYGDLADLCDRVVVLNDGAIRVLLTGQELSEQRIAAECHRPESDEIAATESWDAELRIEDRDAANRS